MSTTFVLVWKDCFHHISIKKSKQPFLILGKCLIKKVFCVSTAMSRPPVHGVPAFCLKAAGIGSSSPMAVENGWTDGYLIHSGNILTAECN